MRACHLVVTKCLLVVIFVFFLLVPDCHSIERWKDTQLIHELQVAKDGEFNMAAEVESRAVKYYDEENNVTRLMTEEGVVKHWLFSRYGLHITDRPVLRHVDTVGVNIKFELLRFLHIDDLRGSMAVLGVAVMTWVNPFLAWQGTNLTESHITRVALKSGEVWTPLILHVNNVKELVNFPTFPQY